MYQSVFYFGHAELAIPSHSGQLSWEKIGKVVNQVKFTVLSHYEPLQWEKIGKVMNWAKLAIPSHSEPLRWEKIGKVANQAKLAVQSHYEPLWWEKITKVATQTKSYLSGGGGGYIIQNHNVMLTQNVVWNLKNRGFLFSVFHKLEMYVCNEGGVDW